MRDAEQTQQKNAERSLFQVKFPFPVSLTSTFLSQRETERRTLPQQTQHTMPPSRFPHQVCQPLSHHTQEKMPPQQMHPQATSGAPVIPKPSIRNTDPQTLNPQPYCRSQRGWTSTRASGRSPMPKKPFSGPTESNQKHPSSSQTCEEGVLSWRVPAPTHGAGACLRVECV